MKDNLIKSTHLSEQEVTMLREKFISEYSRKQGWNSKELTTHQMLEISTHKEYQNPGIILS
jgi:hypothetical protein